MSKRSVIVNDSFMDAYFLPLILHGCEPSLRE
jgi:hypothetical protein